MSTPVGAMAIAQLPTIFREALACHDIIQTFGVPADQIFVSLDAQDRFLVSVPFPSGDAYLGFHVGRLSMTQGGFRAQWDLAVAAYNASPRAERAELLERSKMRDGAVAIIAMLVDAGVKGRPMPSDMPS